MVSRYPGGFFTIVEALLASCGSSQGDIQAPQVDLIGRDMQAGNRRYAFNTGLAKMLLCKYFSGACGNACKAPDVCHLLQFLFHGARLAARGHVGMHVCIMVDSLSFLLPVRIHWHCCFLWGSWVIDKYRLMGRQVCKQQIGDMPFKSL